MATFCFCFNKINKQILSGDNCVNFFVGFNVLVVTIFASFRNMAAANVGGTYGDSVKHIKIDELLAFMKAKNLEELRRVFDIGRAWWDEVLKDMFLTPEFQRVRQ